MRFLIDTNIVAAIIPKLSSEVEVYPFDDNSFLIIERTFNRKVRVNTLTKDLVGNIDGKKNIGEITEALGKGNEGDSIEIVHKIIQSLEDYGIVLSNKIIVPKIKAEYLMLSTPIIKEKHLTVLSSLFRVLFFPKIFWTSLTLMAGALIVLFFSKLSWHQIYEDIKPSLFLYLACAFLISLILHELGHVTACRLFGARHGDIGFGFYLFTPVFYADVSDAWKLKPSERIIIDMAGIHMELLFSLTLACISLLLGESVLLVVSFFIIINTVKNINPFLRFDAYWVLSDLLNIPNLRQNSTRKLFVFVKWLIGRVPNPHFTRKEYFLVVYAGLSVSLVAMFVTIMLFYNSNSVLYFPINLYIFLKEIYNNWGSLDFSWLKFNTINLLVPLSFYILLLSILIKNGVSFKKFLKY